MKIVVKILLAFTLMVLILMVYLFYVAKQADYSNIIPVERNCRHLDTKFDFEAELRKLDLSEIKEIFPYDTYLEHGNYCNAEAIENSLEKLNDINPNNENINREILIYSLTDKLQTKLANRFEKFNPDSLIIILQWIDEFKTYEKIIAKNGALYGIVYDHWMGFISDHLGTHYENNPSVRFNFKFKYLQSVCQSKRFAPAIGKSSLEKVVEYTLGQEYTYLFNRFWNGTGIFIKLMFATFFIIFIYMLYCTYQYSFKKQNL